MRKLKMFFTAAALLLSVFAFAQNITVKGVVTDSSTGEPLSGAAILVKGTPNGVVADNDGNYSISVPANATLGFTTIGFKDAEVAVNGRSVINVALDPDLEMLNETIVVAFGTSTKEAFTGSAKVLDDEALSLSQVTNVTSALAGQVAGVQLVSSNGAPGSNPTIRIRGISSINAGNSPLIVVDGTPYDGDMNNIAPSDIESMTVLKDAASNALYGARGANGVIMITTKSAKKGQAVVSLDAKIGVNTNALRKYNVLTDPRAYYEQHYKALYNYYTNADGLGLNDAVAYIKANQSINDAESGGLGYPIFSVPEGELLMGRNGKVNPNATIGNVLGDFFVQPDDWGKYAYRNGVRQEYTLTVSGAENRLSYFSSISYLDNEGITEKSDHKRLTARLKGTYQAKDWMKVGTNMSYTKFNFNSLGNDGNDSSTANIWAYVSQMAPVYPLYIRNADGSIYKDANGIQVMDHGNGNLDQGGIPGTGRPFITNANPFLANRYNTRNSEGNAMTANGFIDIKPIEGLTITVNAAANLDETRGKYVYNPYYGQFRSTGGTVEVYHTRSYAWNTQQLINYKKSFGLHNMELLAGHEYYDLKDYEVGGSKSKMFSQENTELDGAVVDGQGAFSSQSEYDVEGYFARAQYNYAEKIFASASFRRDASSHFHPAHRWGNFWSAGAAWILSKEDWFNVPAFDEFKVKASIGSQGNDGIGNYKYVDMFDIAPSDGNVSTIFSTKGNPDITWETNTNINAGFEFSSLGGRISGSFEYFNRLTTDLLFSFPVPPSQGYSSIYKNVGDMSNRGVELDLNFNLINTKDIQWDFNVNMSYLKNKIKKLDPAVITTTAYDENGKKYKGYTSGGFFLAEGLPMYTWYTYDYQGVDSETGKSLWNHIELYNDKDGEQYKDADGDYMVKEVTKTDDYTAATRYITRKSTLAPVFGGFGTSLRAYGFDLSMNFTYQLGGHQWDSGYQSFMSSPTNSHTGYNYHVDLLNSWTPENTDTNIPRFAYAETYSSASSTRWLTSASYLNLQNINLGYTLPERISKKFLVSSLRIYAAAENVWYWSCRQGFDPRQSFSSSTSATHYSPMRTVSGGITVKF
ncbi:MAG: TonB-dependent receptor [Bacteroidales bacterium]|nr:TonB-dependent receptor [Bacteroidales bacterium]